MAHPFELTHEFEVDATPEEVWQAIAIGTRRGLLVHGRNEIEPREGGASRMKFAGGGGGLHGHGWEPPTRFASRTPEGPDGALHVFEYLVEGRDKGSTVVRWVHSGFLGDNWEKEYEGLSEGDPMYFDKLRVPDLLQGSHRDAGERLRRDDRARPRRAWKRFHEALDLGGPPAVGDEVALRRRPRAGRRGRLDLPGLPRRAHRRG